MGVDGRLVNVEQRHIAVQYLVQQDDELDQVGVGLLPEGFFATPKEIVQQRSDPVGQRISVQIVVQRIVPVGESSLTSM